MTDNEVLFLSATVLAVSCAWMAGVSMLVGMINYPTFATVPNDKWQEFHKNHCQKMGKVVMVPMLMQLSCSIGLSMKVAWSGNEIWQILNILGLIGSFGLTFLISSPLHHKISQGIKDNLLNKLIATNHVRTSFWIVHSIASLYFVLRVLLIDTAK